MKNFLKQYQLVLRYFFALTEKHRIGTVLQMGSTLLIQIYHMIVAPLMIASLFLSLTSGDRNTLYSSVAINGGVIVIFFILAYLNNTYIDMNTFKTNLHINENVLKKLFACSQERLNRFEGGDIQTRVSQNSLAYLSIFIFSITFIATVISVIILLALAGTFSLVLLVFITVTAMFSILASNVLVPKVQKFEEQIQKYESENEVIARVVINQVNFARIYHLQYKLMADYQAIRENSWRFEWQKVRASLVISSLMELITSFFRGSLGILFYPMYAAGGVGQENIVTSFSIYDKLRGISNGIHEPLAIINKNMIVIKRMDEVLKLQKEEKITHENTRLKNSTVDQILQIKNLSYQNEGTFILKDLSFEIKPGEKVAIIGHSGSGKTTLLKTIAGLYNNYQGEIKIIDTPSRNLGDFEKRELISYIPSNEYLYQETLKENILMRSDENNDNRLAYVLEKTQIDDTLADSNAKEISGG